MANVGAQRLMRKDPAVTDVNNIQPYLAKLEKKPQSRSPFSIKQQQLMLFETWRIRRKAEHYIHMADMAEQLGVSTTTLRSVIRRAGLMYSKPSDNTRASKEVKEKRRAQLKKTIKQKKLNADKRLIRDGTEERTTWLHITKAIAGAA